MREAHDCAARSGRNQRHVRNTNIMSAANAGTDTTYTAATSQTFTPAAAQHLSIAAWAVTGGAASSTLRTQVKYQDGATPPAATTDAVPVTVRDAPPALMLATSRTS